MWDTVVEGTTHLSHDPLCARCGHAGHHYLPCDRCECTARGLVAAPVADRGEPGRAA